MKPFVYENTHTKLPGWVDNVHIGQPRGYAYEHNGYFVHIYGGNDGFHVLSTGLTASQKIEGTLEQWIDTNFGANNIQNGIFDVGKVVEGVWRPGLYFRDQIYQAFNTDSYKQRSSEQALSILISKLEELLLYVEPSADGLRSYSHKSRELLIAACTEVENSWVQYMRTAGARPTGRDFSTRDYVKLANPLYLEEYKVTFRPYRGLPSLTPFSGWDVARPTQSLPWYDAYNKTKHDRESHFAEANLQMCLQATAANIVMFCVRYSPYPLLEGEGSLSRMFNQIFEVELVSPSASSFYVPKVEFSTNDYTSDLVCGDSKEFIVPWVKSTLAL